jgi:regulator of sirC expression with transglutaminase-like and TPR domain
MDATRPAYCRPEAFDAFIAALPTAGTPAGLFRAAWAVAQHERPQADLAAGEVVIENLIAAIRRRIRSTSEEAKLAHLHDVMFDVLGFRGNVDDYYNPANSYLPEVLRSRRGLPITLTLVYRRVAAGLDITVHGINAPGHFLAEIESSSPHETKRTRTFVDPFFGGGLLDEREAYQRIAQATGQELKPSAKHLERAAADQWLGRMLNNLQAVFAASGRERDLYAMQEMQSLL